MSDENSPGSNVAAKEAIARDTRERLQRLIDSKDHAPLVALAFELVHRGDRSLLVDALDALRHVAVEHPGLLDASHARSLLPFLKDDDDIVRASAVLALKHLVLAMPDDMHDVLIKVIQEHGAPQCMEESVRLLGHLGTRHPEKIERDLDMFLSLLHDDDVHVRKRSVDVIKILGRVVPDKIEQALKLEFASDSCPGDIVEGIDEILTGIIKKREMHGRDDKLPSSKEEPRELIPDIELESKKEQDVPLPPTEPGKEVEMADDQLPAKSDEDIAREIGENIEAEFSKIEDAGKPVPGKEMKEIKSEKDLEPAPDTSTTPVVEPSRDAPVSKDDLVKKQMAMKEKALTRREDELKQLEIEKKELEIQARELDMEREELKRAKLEQMEMEIKRKEEEIREKELQFKLKELEERARKLKELEDKLSNNP